MPYPILLYPEPLSMWQSTTNRYLHGTHKCSFVCLCGVPGSLCAQELSESSEHLWEEWGLILNGSSPLYCLAGASPLPLDMGYLLQPLQPLPSYWSFFDLRRGVSPHGWSSEVILKIQQTFFLSPSLISFSRI